MKDTYNQYTDSVAVIGKQTQHFDNMFGKIVVGDLNVCDRVIRPIR